MFTRIPSIESDEIFHPLHVVSNKFVGIIKSIFFSNYWISDKTVYRRIKRRILKLYH